MQDEIFFLLGGMDEGHCPIPGTSIVEQQHVPHFLVIIIFVKIFIVKDANYKIHLN